MKKFAYAAFTSAAALALAACGSSEDAMDEAQTETTETMADEAMDPMASESVMADDSMMAEDPMASEMPSEMATEEAM